MNTAEILYKGGLRAESIHLRSGNVIVADAPVDNHGKGEAFSPTDLAATSLGICMVTVMGILADAHNIDIDGTRITIMKHMGSDPRRISGIDVDLYMPDRDYSDKEKKMLEHTAYNCPVAKSLHPDIVQNVKFHWKNL
ncbi:MAG TPA: OsmC family protein [Saprospiraceae bacterium]|nr:OsmC family protein [Saprospiraceae bacterium]